MRIWLVGVVLVACGGKKAEQKAEGSAGSALPLPAPADAAPPIDAAVDAGAAFATTITNDGIGPFDAQLENSTDAIGKLVPGLEVKSEHSESEAHDIDQIEITKTGKPVLKMVMDNYRAGPKLFTMDALDPMFMTASGIGPGSPVKDLVAKHADTKCVFEVYDAEADVLGVDRRLYCFTKELSNLAFELDPKAYKGKKGNVATDKLADAKLVSVGWRTPIE